MGLRFCLAAMLGFVSPLAAADTAYVKPSSFYPEADQTITIEVAFNDFCCEPRYAVRTDTYAVHLPDGTVETPERLEVFKTTTMLEHRLSQSGTTRISTGERLGRKGEYVYLNGRYHLVNSRDADPIDIPEGTPILTSQTATVTDSYVTIGAPDWTVIRAPVGRLRITPAIHPSRLNVGSPFIARVTFDGEPVADLDVIIDTEYQRMAGLNSSSVRTDQNGVFTTYFDTPGLAQIWGRMQAPAPDGADTDIRSYTTAITLNVDVSRK